MKKKYVRALVYVMTIILLTLLTIYLSNSLNAKAAEPQHGRALAGMSKYMEDFRAKGGKLYDEYDLKLLSEVMYHENGSNSDKCILYTGSVVLNRVESKSWPNNIHDVLYQKGQYSTTGMFFTKKIPGRIEALAKELLIFGSQLPVEYVFQAMFIQSSEYIKVDTEYFCKGR